MLAEIDRLLAGPPAAGMIGIVSEDLSAPDFLLMSITSYAMKRQIKVIYLSATRNEHAVRIMANKLMIRLSDKMRYVSLCQCLPDGFISSGESFCMQLLQKIEEQIEQNDKEVFILFDNFTAFCDLVGLPSIVPTFIRRLQQLVFDKNAEPLLALTIQSADRCSNIVLHECDIILRIKRIGNGFAKDVTGQLRILERNGEAPYAESIFNYHLSDRSVRLFLPGMSRPQL